jgi:hypothetical protein
MVNKMKKRYPAVERAGALLACIVMTLPWCATARADEAEKPAPAVAAKPAQPIRLPALKLGGIRSGQVMMITESGVEHVQATMLAQLQTRKPALLSEFCLVH